MATTLDQSVVQMYQESRAKQFIEALEQETADLPNYATVERVGNVKLHLVPVSGTREFGHREARKEEITATENTYGWRSMRPIIMDDWAELNTLDPHFLDNLPINLTNVAKMQGHAAGRAKDGILMGTTVCTDTSLPVYGEMIVRTNTAVSDSDKNTPFKGGTTSGIFGTAYEGEYGDKAVELPLQPTIVGTSGAVSAWTNYVSSSVLNLRTTNVIPVNYVESGSTFAATGITPAKITAALTAMRARKAKGTLALAVTPQQAMDLLNNEQMRNMLYGYQTLKNGLPESILGVRLLVTDHVPLVNIGTSSAAKWVRACPMWQVDDLVYGIWSDVRFEVRQPQHMKSTIYAGATLMWGATRRREETFISILCDEGIA